MLVMPVTSHSKFDMRLLQQHIHEARIYMSECEKQNKKVLDVCGERGDLYFLLTACLLHENQSTSDLSIEGLRG